MTFEMKIMLAVLFTLLTVIAFYWRAGQRKDYDGPATGNPQPPTDYPRPVPGEPVDWDRVWCKAVAAGLDPESESAAGFLTSIRQHTGDPTWMPPECD